MSSLPSPTCSPPHCPWAQEPRFSPHWGHQSLPQPHGWSASFQPSLRPCLLEGPWLFSAGSSSPRWNLRRPPPLAPRWCPWLASGPGSSLVMLGVVNDAVTSTLRCPPCAGPVGLPPLERAQPVMGSPSAPGSLLLGELLALAALLHIYLMSLIESFVFH